MTRRVLILAYDFPPRGATSVFRVAKFVRYLPEFGWQPVVVTAAVKGGVRDDALLAQLPADLEVLRVPNPFAPGGAGMGAHTAAPSLQARMRGRLRRLMIPDAQLLWVPAAVRAARARLAGGDIHAMFSTAPPYSVHLAALWLRRRHPHIPWLMDLRDIWSTNPAITRLTTYKLQRACEAACLAAADHITTATDGQRRLIERQFGVPPARISTITNGFDSADLATESLLAQSEGPFTVRYFGSIIGNRADATAGLFGALHMLHAAGLTGAELRVELLGIFDQRIYAAAEVLAASGLLAVKPFVPQAEAYAAMTASDALLLIAADDREGRLSHPNKLFEYLAVGRPVLALAPEGDVARLVRNSDAGTVVAPGDVAGIAAALRRMRTSRAGTMPAAGGGAARFGQFERRELTRQLAARLDALVS